MVAVNESSVSIWRGGIAREPSSSALAHEDTYFDEGQTGTHLQRDSASSSRILRLLTANRSFDHFRALSLIKSELARVPIAAPWQVI